MPDAHRDSVGAIYSGVHERDQLGNGLRSSRVVSLDECRPEAFPEPASPPAFTSHSSPILTVPFLTPPAFPFFGIPRSVKPFYDCAATANQAAPGPSVPVTADPCLRHLVNPLRATPFPYGPVPAPHCLRCIVSPVQSVPSLYSPRLHYRTAPFPSGSDSSTPCLHRRSINRTIRSAHGHAEPCPSSPALLYQSAPVPDIPRIYSPSLQWRAWPFPAKPVHSDAFHASPLLLLESKP